MKEHQYPDENDGLTIKFLAEFEKSKRLRKKYKELIRQLTARIKYLRKALHGKENV